MTLTLALVLATGASACGGDNPTRPEKVKLGREVTLALGKAAALTDGSAEVRFLEVLEDSRCPRDVTCIWAGQVKLRVSLKARGQEPTDREMLQGETAAVGGRELKVLAVEPAPVSTRKIEPGDYRVTFRLSAAAP